MRCSTHNYEYGKGRCPHCDQRRHNNKIEVTSRAQLNSATVQQTELQRIRNEAEQRDQDAIQRERARQIQDKIIGDEKIILEFIPEAVERYGADFIARFYLRFIIEPESLIETSTTEEAVHAHFFQKMSDAGRKICLLQDELKSTIEVNKEALKDQIISNIGKKEDEALKGQIIRRIIFLASIVGSLWIWEVSSIVDFLAGGIGGSLIGFILSSVFTSKINLQQYQTAEWHRLAIYEKSLIWFNNEQQQSKNLYETLLKSQRLAFLILEDWRLEGSKSLTKNILAERRRAIKPQET